MGGGPRSSPPLREASCIWDGPSWDPHSHRPRPGPPRRSPGLRYQPPNWIPCLQPRPAPAPPPHCSQRELSRTQTCACHSSTGRPQAPCCPQHGQRCVPETGERSFHLQCPFLFVKVLLCPEAAKWPRPAQPSGHSCQGLTPPPRELRGPHALPERQWSPQMPSDRAGRPAREVTAQRRKQAARASLDSAHLALG